MFQPFSNRSILFLFLNSLVITCHSILGIMGKIVVPKKKEGKNYSILQVNAFFFLVISHFTLALSAATETMQTCIC